MEDQANPGKLFSVEKMVVVITGGATGIGLMMTKAFALNGAAKVYIVGRRKEKLEEAAKVSPHGNIVAVTGDVTSKESLCRIAELIKEEIGYVNLLCCNSGVMPSPTAAQPKDASVEEFARAMLAQKPEEWNNTFATNSTSIYFAAAAFLELLDAGNKKGNSPNRKSQVLVTSSIAGFLRVPGSNIPYGASKAAATHIVKHLAGTLVPYSIRVNGIAPGLFPSDLAAGLIAGGGASKQDPTEEGAFGKTFIPAERIGRTQDIVGTMLYMASEAGAYLNGNITVLDGGRISQLPGVY